MNELEFNDSYATFEALDTIYSTLESESNTFKAVVTTGYLMESGASSDIIMESVSDIFSSIVEGIKNFIEKVKEFFKKMILFITSLFKDLDKVAEEVKKVIEGKDIEFTINGYEFTVLDKQGPDVTEFQSIVNRYNEDMEAIKELKEKDIREEITNWLDDNNLDKLRGQVLRVNDSIPEDDYNEEVRMYYRNGEKDTKEIKITTSKVNDIINHAKKLEETKKSSIKDRDNLVSLLSKTETFFNRSMPIVYKGSAKYAGLDKVDVSDGTFKHEKNSVKVENDTMSKIVVLYSSYKAKQVNKIASMINLVASERVNALKDQIKQERTILRKCLFGNTKSETKATTTESIGIDGKPYDIIAMESSIKEYPIYESMIRSNLLQEANFMIKSLTTGEVSSVFEADTAKTSGKIIQAVSDVVDKVVLSFIKKAKGESEKYIPWIEEITSDDNKLNEKAQAKQDFTMSDYFGVDYASILNKIKSAINTAYKNTKYDDVSWARNIYDPIDSAEKLRDTKLREEMTNYFRTGKKGEALSKITMTGSQLASNIPKMTDYIKNYGTKVSGEMKSISDAFKSASENMKVTESFSGDSYLSLLGCPVCESDVILCRNYRSVFGDIIMEADDVTNANKDNKANTPNANAGDTGKANKANANAAKEQTKSADDMKSATSTVSNDDPEKTATLKSEEANKKGNGPAVAYKKMVDRFFKNCITWMLIAREQQFISFVGALSDIDGEKPQFGDDGKYITKADRAKDKKAPEQVESNNKEPKETKETKK